MANLRYLKERASACREAARAASDRRECDDLLHLARVYEQQVQQLSTKRRQQVQA